MTNDVHVTLRIPAQLAEELDAVVKGGAFQTRSHAVRHAVMALLFEVSAGD